VYWDRETKRFGVRHTPSGCLSFIIQFRNRQGKSRRLTIGEYGSWTPALAREEAKRLLHIVDEGGDPAQTRLEDREAIAFEQLVAEYMAKAEAGQLPRKTQKKAGTLLVDRYRVQHLLRYFGSRAVEDITRLDCQRCLAKLVAGNHGAARTMGLLGGILSYAVKENHIHENPARGIERPADGEREFKLDNAGAGSRGATWRALAGHHGNSFVGTDRLSPGRDPQPAVDRGGRGRPLLAAGGQQDRARPWSPLGRQDAGACPRCCKSRQLAWSAMCQLRP
jgi:Arm DNA-binding domain